MQAATVRNRELWARASVRRAALLVAIVVALAVPKLLLSSYSHDPGIDGGYYTEVARHVSEGRGLVTNVSLYHKSYSYFPHPTSVYPLWPLAYGHAAKLVSLDVAGVWLPALLYFVALLAGYAWASRLWPGDLFPSALPGMNSGHVFALLLGLQGDFFYYTSKPFTEALGYAVLALGLWRSVDLWSRPSWWRGLEVGLWLAVMALVRSQLFIVAAVALGAMFWSIALSRQRLRFSLATVGMVIGLAAPVSLHYLRIVTFIEDPHLWSLLRFDFNREASWLTRVQMIYEPARAIDWIADRLRGFAIAFAPTGKHSYSNTFYGLQYAPVLAAGLLAVRVVRKVASDDVRTLLGRVREPRALGWPFVILLSVMGFASIHAIHKVFRVEWNFATQQALTCLFLFFISLVYLLRSSNRVMYVAGVLLLCGFCYLGYRQAWLAVGDEPARTERFHRRYDEVIGWLKREQQRGQVVAVMPDGHCQRVASRVEGAHFRWIYSGTTLDDLEQMVEYQGATHLIVPLRSRRWRGLVRFINRGWTVPGSLERAGPFRIYELGRPNMEPIP